VAENWIHRQLIHLQHFSKYAYTIPFHLKKRGFEFSNQNTIAVFAQPRGGSTWFTNLLTAMPNTSKIDGPLYQGFFLPDGKMPSGEAAKLKSLKRLGFHYHQYIPEIEEWEQAQAFFHRLFSQQFYTPYIFNETSLSELKRAEKFVFKFYHASLMMPWLIEHFDIKPIFLVRNPYAVVASQLKYQAFAETIKTGQYRLPKFRFSEFFDPYLPILDEVSSAVEILATRWCLNYLPLITREDNNKKWLTVSYESVILHRDWELNRIFQFVGQPIPENINSVYDKPSISTTKSSEAYHQKLEHLGSWKDTLSTKEIEQIDIILKRFGVKRYSQELEPDYEFIYNGEEIPPAP
jgi:hypothetical protein